MFQGGVIVHEVYKNGAAEKDGRIQPGDFIVSVDGKAFKECTHKEALQSLRFTKDRVKIIIDRRQNQTDLYQDIEVELTKKPGKGLGLSVVGRRDGNGVFISDMVHKFHNFSTTQILCEICFRDFRSAKSAIFTQFEALNFDFYEFLHFLKNPQFNKIHSS